MKYYFEKFYGKETFKSVRPVFILSTSDYDSSYFT